MARPRHLRHAPITEAVIDFRLEPLTPISVETLATQLAQRGNFGYVLKGPVIRGEFGFSVKMEEAQAIAHADATRIGVRMHSVDEKYVAQLSVEGFTVSRLEPYESWEVLLAEARRIWDGYAACLGPSTITRTATRYINNLRLPIAAPLEQYLALLPSIPPGLPDALSGFLHRYVLNEVESEATVILTQALEEALIDKPLPVILDIDVFGTAKFAGNEPQVWRYLERLRRLKNNVFFGCLTETAVELYL